MTLPTDVWYDCRLDKCTVIQLDPPEHLQGCNFIVSTTESYAELWKNGDFIKISGYLDEETWMVEVPLNNEPIACIINRPIQSRKNANFLHNSNFQSLIMPLENPGLGLIESILKVDIPSLALHNLIFLTGTFIGLSSIALLISGVAFLVNLLREINSK